jgi:hypothetical protein
MEGMGGVQHGDRPSINWRRCVCVRVSTELSVDCLSVRS